MYAAARFLGIRASEFNELPWWEQKLYVEGLSKERPWVYRAAMLQKTQDPLKGAFPSEGVADADDEDFLSSTGFQVRRV